MSLLLLALFGAVANGNQQFIDCVGQVLTDADCAHSGLGYSTCNEWLGDGSCDNGFTLTDSDIQMFLNCPKFDNDGGDCDTGGDFGCADASMSSGSCPTPEDDQIVDCWGQVLSDEDCAVSSLGYTKCSDWWGDGSCDGGQHLSDKDLLLNFNCADFNFDSMDCYTGTFSPSTSPTPFPSLSPSPAPSPQPTRSPTKSPSPSPTNPPSEQPTKAPTKSPSPAPTDMPTNSPTTAFPTPAPTIDRWANPGQPLSDPSGASAENAHFDLFWKSPGALMDDPSGRGPLDSLDFLVESPATGWSPTEEGSPTASSADVTCNNNQYSAGILSGWAWIPANTGQVQVTVTTTAPTWFFMGGKQVAGVQAGAGQIFEVSDSSGALKHGQWNRLQAITASNCGVGQVTFDNIQDVPVCSNEKDDALCLYWAQLPALCNDPDVKLYCKKTCRVQIGCVLPSAADPNAIYPFEHNFNGAAGNGDEGVGRGGVSTEQDSMRGGVLSMESGDVITNVSENKPLSVCAWVNPADKAGRMTVVDSATSCDEEGTGVMIQDGVFHVYNHAAPVSTGQAAHPGKWQQICTIFEEGNIQFWFNGMNVYDAAYTAGTMDGGKFSIGARCADDAIDFDNVKDEDVNKVTGTDAFDGLIDDVGFWELALNMHEISSQYAAQHHKGIDVDVGTRVSINYQGTGDYYTGTVKAVNVGIGGSPDTYDVVYDDGEEESGVSTSNLKILRNERRNSKFRLREQVRVDKYNLGTLHEATVRIVQDAQDGVQYTVEYDNGDVETNVPFERMTTIVKYVRGSRIRAKQCFWYDGQIEDLNPDGQYLVKFLDGSGFFTNVDYADLQPASLIVYEIGDKVMYEKDDGSFVQGYIVASNADEDEYGVGYSGTVEWNVPSARLSAFQEG